MNQAHATSMLLEQLSTELKAQSLWSAITPSSQQLNSQQPFALDTLSFEQWLQFIFIPKLQALIAQNAVLPSKLTLLPYAQEVWGSRGDKHQKLLTIIQALDEIYN